MDKRVTIIAWRDLWNPEAGGAEVYITKLAHRLVSDGYSVTFLTPMYQGSQEEEVKDGVHYFRVGSKYLSYFLIPIFFIRKLKGQTDLLIENFNAWPYLSPLLHKNVLIAFMHLQDKEWYDHFPVGFKTLGGGFFKLLTRFVLKVIYRKQEMITISPSSAESINRLRLNQKSLNFIYPGIEDNLVDGSLDAVVHKKMLTEKRFSYVGRLSRSKRVDQCIRLVSDLKELGCLVKLDIGGKGEELDNLKALCKELKIEDQVEFHGYIAEEEKFRIFRDSHIHLQLSQFEGWGITVIEAASQGTPTLAFDVMGLRDSVGESGYLVMDYEELLSISREICEDIDSGSNDSEYFMKVSSTLKWADRFSWGQQLNKFGTIVRELLTSRDTLK